MRTTVMSTDIELAARTLLRLMQLASPALPVGGFSYSEGLESAVDQALVGDEAQAGDWLLDQLALSLARCDLPVVAQALRGWQQDRTDSVQALNDWVGATRESAEMRQQTRQMGRSLAVWLANDGPPGDARVARLAALQPSPTWPVAYALAATLTGAPSRAALLGFAFGWAENMVQAAMRCVPLGQAAAQRILARLMADIPPAVDRAIDLPDMQRQAFTPMLAVLSANHEIQYSRLFRS
jgi:urease accessory protein